jgi:hypothetical protein
MLRIGYEVHLTDYGWKQGVVYDGMATGTTGFGIHIEAIRFAFLPISLECRAHVAGKGWLEWKREGEIVGTIGDRLALEAIQFRNKPNTPAEFSVHVLGRAHVSFEGWQPLGSGMAPGFLGTVGKSHAVEAIQLWAVVPVELLELDEDKTLQDHAVALRAAKGLPAATTVLNEHTKESAQCMISLGMAGAACRGTDKFGCTMGAVNAAVQCAKAVEKGLEFVKELVNKMSPGGRDAGRGGGNVGGGGGPPASPDGCTKPDRPGPGHIHDRNTKPDV